jgi:hypothetical protein
VALDDARIAELLARDRDALLDACSLPTTAQALFRVRLRASRDRAARVSTLVEYLVLALGLVPLIAAVATVLQFALSDRAFVVVAGALGIGGMAVMAALAAMRTNAPGTRTRRRGAMP